ncbi:Rha family transcriptional regulator [Curvibacter sp. HBC28]|uniref:Rha family transcriptional regulator n=1 Tax=Curvibacter microcysteis TaxID=3026419 RepID=A0ABT5MCI2_9BURK|nr:Rha family transcriptional regulator [Curvibacter sp. HBC28]MDD0814284.1 Rha family transcriptional regulator [Curvibacter sp. HBC28]
MQNFSDLTAFIDRQGKELVTDSRAVALAFKKRHKNVLRTIDRMRASNHQEIAEHYRLNFEPVEFQDAKGERRPMYRMTAKGLSELAMSFSGDEARVVRIRFLNAFEAVAERLAQAERSITAMLMDLEQREVPSVVKGQIGSKLMNERKVEKRDYAEERASLMAKAQPGLFLN